MMIGIRKFIIKHRIEEKVLGLCAVLSFAGVVGAKYLEASGFDWKEQMKKEREENPLFGRRQYPGESDEDYEKSKSTFSKFVDRWYR